MLNPNLRDKLDMVFRSIEHLQKLSDQLSRRLQRSMTDLESQNELCRTPLSHSEVKKLLQLNRCLTTIELLSRSFCGAIRRDIEDQMASPDNPLQDFNIDVELQHVLSESDLDYEVGLSDNFLTVQSFHDWDAELDPIDWSQVCRYKELNIEPHCYLFHDLYDHGGRGAYPATPPKECLRIGTVLVDVKVTYQFEMNIETGSWVKRSIPHPSPKIGGHSHEAGSRSE